MKITSLMKSQQIQSGGGGETSVYEKVGDARGLAQELLGMLIKEFGLI